MLNLNVTPFGGGDAELTKVKDVVTCEHEVDRQFDVETFLTDHAIQGKRLDLVAHSTAGACVLELGEWIVDTDPKNRVEVFFTSFRQRLLDIGVDEVRLLGCLTGDTMEGKRTLLLIQNALGSAIKVLGTKALIFAGDFTPTGFDETHHASKLVSATQVTSPARWTNNPWPRDAVEIGPLDLEALPPIHGPGDDGVGWPVRLDVEPLSSEELVPLLRSGGRLLPGLLTVPSLEIRFRLGAGDPGFRRLQVLLDGQLLRVYPGETADGPHPDGAVYFAEQPAAMRALLKVPAPHI